MLLNEAHESKVIMHPRDGRYHAPAPEHGNRTCLQWLPQGLLSGQLLGVTPWQSPLVLKGQAGPVSRGLVLAALAFGSQPAIGSQPTADLTGVLAGLSAGSAGALAELGKIERHEERSRPSD